MRNSQNRKHILISGVIAAVLCSALFLGTTFAWFSNSVTNQNNKIIAGNLDFIIYDVTDGTSIEPVQTTKDDVTVYSVLFEDISWKPGTVAYENLTVQNTGNIDAKYRVSLNWGDFNYIPDGDADETNDRSLKDVIKVAVVEKHIVIEEETADMDAAILEAVGSEWADISTYMFEGSMPTNVENAVAENISDSDANAAEKNIAVVVYWESTADDNAYNSLAHTTNDNKPLHIDLGIKFEATQVSGEFESFSSQE